MKSDVAKQFGRFLDALSSEDRTYCDDDVSWQIYYDMFRIRDAQWRYKVAVNRGRDYSLGDIFQDVLAKYLRMNLPGYSVVLERRQNKLQPDILILKAGRPWAAIEVKTNIGFHREMLRDSQYLERLQTLSEEFDIPLKRVFYVFESARNVGKWFTEIFLEEKQDTMREHIFPLFDHTPSPFYIAKFDMGMDVKNDYKKLSLSVAQEHYGRVKITDFKIILKKVKG